MNQYVGKYNFHQTLKFHGIQQTYMAPGHNVMLWEVQRWTKYSPSSVHDLVGKADTDKSISQVDNEQTMRSVQNIIRK